MNNKAVQKALHVLIFTAEYAIFLVGIFLKNYCGIVLILLSLSLMAMTSSFRLSAKQNKHGLSFCLSLATMVGTAYAIFVIGYLLYSKYFAQSPDYHCNLANIYTPFFYISLIVVVLISFVSEILSYCFFKSVAKSDSSIGACLLFFLAAACIACGLFEWSKVPFYLISIFVASFALGIGFSACKSLKNSAILLALFLLLSSYTILASLSYIKPMPTTNNYTYSEGIDRGGYLFTASRILGVFSFISYTTFGIIGLLERSKTRSAR